VANAFEELDAADEFYVDRRERAVYIAVQVPADPNDNVESFILAAGPRELVRIQGTAAAPVRDLSFFGVEFAHTAVEEQRIDTGGSAQSAADLATAAVHVRFASDVSFTACTIRATGGYGFWTEQETYRVSVVRSLFTDLGAGGIRTGRNARWAVSRAELLDPPECEHHNFSDNIITEGGHVWHEGVGIFVQGAGNITISHNEVSYLRYSGVSTGWTWGYGATVVHDIRTSFNHIHHIGLGYLSDMACVYTLGHQPGSTVSNNYCHDVQSYDYGGWGYYTDEGSRQEVFTNNIAYRTKCAGHFQHYGSDNLITNNLYVDVNRGDVKTLGRPSILNPTCDFAIGSGTHPRDPSICPDPASTPFKKGCCCAPAVGCDMGMCSSFKFTNNIVYLPRLSRSTFTGHSHFVRGLQNFTFARNLYFKAGAPTGAQLFNAMNTGGKEVAEDFADWQGGAYQQTAQDVGSLFNQDPKLGPDFTIADDSPARTLGFVPIDVSSIGPRSPSIGAPRLPLRTSATAL
jgi:hypothetical protein